MKYIIFIVPLLLFGCGGADPAPNASVCGDIYNEGQDSDCRKTNTAALIEKDIGDLSRSHFIWSELQVNNPTGSDIEGYIQVYIDAGCGGQGDWEIVPKHKVIFKSNDTFTTNTGGQCGDMPLGQHTATVTAWDADATTELGKVVITFNTIE